MLPTWAQVTVDSFQNLWQGLIGFLPNIIVAVLVFAIGWLVASGFGRLVEEIIKKLKVDQAIERIGGKAFQRAKVKINSGHWLNVVVKVFVIIVALMASAEILHLTQVSEFLKSVAGYIPKIIAAVVILLFGVWLANFVGRIVRTVAFGGRVKSAAFLGGLTRWAILIFAFIAALNQLGESTLPIMMQTLFQAIVYGTALAVGLAFGLGGKDEAMRTIDRIRRSVSHEE